MAGYARIQAGTPEYGFVQRSAASHVGDGRRGEGSPNLQRGSLRRGKKTRENKALPNTMVVKHGCRPVHLPRTPMPDVQDETAFPSLRTAAAEGGR